LLCFFHDHLISIVYWVYDLIGKYFVLRKKHIPSYYTRYPNFQKMIGLLSLCNVPVLKNLSIQWWIWLTGNQTQYHWIYKYFLSLLINNDKFFKTGTLQSDKSPIIFWKFGYLV
jgi:hypothetical protein